jgi:hypothetical protein
VLLNVYAVVAESSFSRCCVNGGATAARCIGCTGLVGGSQSGQNTTSRTRKGPRGGASTDIELARVGVFVADLLLPVPRGHALGEQLRDTNADAAG